jgi:hypothetical protein
MVNIELFKIRLIFGRWNTSERLRVVNNAIRKLKLSAVFEKSSKLTN